MWYSTKYYMYTFPVNKLNLVWYGSINRLATLWRHQMETFSALLAICAGNSLVPGEFHAQRPVTRSFGVFFDLHPNKLLSKHSCGCWFDMLPRPSWRHRSELTVILRSPSGEIVNRLLFSSRPLCFHVNSGSGKPETRQEIKTFCITAHFVCVSGTSMNTGGSNAAVEWKCDPEKNKQSNEAIRLFSFR